MKRRGLAQSFSSARRRRDEGTSLKLSQLCSQIRGRIPADAGMTAGGVTPAEAEVRATCLGGAPPRLCPMETYIVGYALALR